MAALLADVLAALGEGAGASWARLADVDDITGLVATT